MTCGRTAGMLSSCLSSRCPTKQGHENQWTVCGREGPTRTYRGKCDLGKFGAVRRGGGICQNKDRNKFKNII